MTEVIEPKTRNGGYQTRCRLGTRTAARHQAQLSTPQRDGRLSG